MKLRERLIRWRDERLDAAMVEAAEYRDALDHDALEIARKALGR